jgi:ABC-type branched-subunit amino acid transport system substrate-binding protein
MQEYAKKMDIDLVMVEPVTFETTDFTPTVMKVRAAKADYVIFWSWSVPVSTRFIKAARQYLPKTEILSLNYLAWEIFFSTLGKDFDGVYFLSPYPRPSETNNPLVARMLATAKEENREIKIWDLYFQGYLMALMCADAAKRADEAGKLTRDGVRDLLENLTNWDLFGMYEGKTIDYSTHDLPRARMLKADFESKSLKPVTDWFLVKEYLK